MRILVSITASPELTYGGRLWSDAARGLCGGLARTIGAYLGLENGETATCMSLAEYMVKPLVLIAEVKLFDADSVDESEKILGLVSSHFIEFLKQNPTRLPFNEAVLVYCHTPALSVYKVCP